MPNLRKPDCCRFVIAAMLLAGLVSLDVPLEAQEQKNQSTPTQTQDQNPFQLKVSSDLVVVRVVVRDAQGKPMEGLRKEDFRLFDQGKEQSISQFEVETPLAAASDAPVQAPEQVSQPSQPSPTPLKFTVLNFDIFNSSDVDLIHARNAADRYLAANLHPNERVAIFASGTMLSDFTADLAQIHNALFKLRVIPPAQSQSRECPHLSDLQALEITQSVTKNTEAWRLAINEAGQCWVPVATTRLMHDEIRIIAMRIVGQTQTLVRSNLDGLEHVVDYVGRMPGQRSVILVSPGFLSQSEQRDVDRVIDRALRSQVVISSLDPRGLAVLLWEGNAPQSNAPVSKEIADRHTMERKRESAASQVLSEVASGTGGEFFHSDNDLKGGFGRLSGAPVSYTLAFSPSRMKQNGKFHTIKVILASKEQGIGIQARRGYFAPRKSTDSKSKNQQQASRVAPEAQPAEPIREPRVAKIEPQQPPVTPGVAQTLPQSVAVPATLAPSSEGADVPRTEANSTYVDYPWEQLRSLVPALHGLKPDSDQSKLSAILEQVGHSIANSLRQIPNLISREDTSYFTVDMSGHGNIAGYVGTLQLPKTTHCNYLILFRRDSSGVNVEEYRTDAKQRKINPLDDSHSVHGFGFVNQWLLFSPANQPDLRFRYLGEQKTDGRKTYAIAFAQIPEQTNNPAEFSSGKLMIPFLYQGVIWIDQSTYAIVSLTTDLQTPLPRVNVQRFTTELHFHSVRIPKIEAALWLPRNVEITVNQSDNILRELHRYSDYRLYRAQSRIVLTH